MKKLALILFFIPFFASATTILPYNPAPSFWDKVSSCRLDIPCYFRQNLGSTITSISGSTQVSAFPTIYNTNNTNLNNDKFEISAWFATTSATQIVKVGTITTGTWNATTIAGGYGGTGSTTLSANQVMLGNGSSGLTNVVGWGTSGQVLGSNGNNSAPTWQSSAFDSTASYNMTGTYFGIKNLLASSTAANPLTLNTLAYNTPSVRAASSSVLMEDGSGNLTWNSSFARKIYVSTTAVGAPQTSSTTWLQATIPANTLGTSNAVKCSAYAADSFAVLNADIVWIEVSYGNSTTTLAISPGSTQGDRFVDLYLIGAGATNSQKFALLGYGTGTYTESKLYQSGTFSIDSTASRQLNVVVKAQNASEGLLLDAIVCTAIK